jgi:hypothetical protein
MRGRSLRYPLLDDAHLVVHAEHPDHALSSTADIVFCYRAELAAPAAEWLAATARRFPAVRLVAIVDGDGCLVLSREAGTLRTMLSDPLLGTTRDPLLAASALYAAWEDPEILPTTIHLTVGRAHGSCRVTTVQPS